MSTVPWRNAALPDNGENLQQTSLGARATALLPWFAAAIAIAIVDQVTKGMVVERLALYQRHEILPVLDFVRLQNTGAAFSFLAGAGGWQRWLFIAIAVGVSVAIIWWLTTLRLDRERLLALGLTLVLGGALGNLFDRVALGYVVDFVLVHYGDWSFPAFNVADSAITCGAALVIFDGLFLEPKRRQP
jgi:signal peptidase II